jgi:hypothetical protein
MSNKFTIDWSDSGQEPECAPYPQGIDVDMSNGRMACHVPLPYPARRIGYYLVQCHACRGQFAVTTAGRPDDPRSVRVPCQYQSGGQA